MNKIKVLLIEDDRSISNFITATMDREGYKIMHALNGREGLSLSTSFCPNVILLDLGLPDMDGLDVLQKLRSWSDPDRIPAAYTFSGKFRQSPDLQLYHECHLGSLYGQ